MNFLCAGIFVQLHSEISIVAMNFPFNSSQISCPFVTMLTSKLASVPMTVPGATLLYNAMADAGRRLR